MLALLLLVTRALGHSVCAAQEVLLELLHQRYTRHMGRLASANRRVKEAADKALGERDTLLQELRSETSRADR